MKNEELSSEGGSRRSENAEIQNAGNQNAENGRWKKENRGRKANSEQRITNNEWGTTDTNLLLIFFYEKYIFCIIDDGGLTGFQPDQGHKSDHFAG